MNQRPRKNKPRMKEMTLDGNVSAHPITSSQSTSTSLYYSYKVIKTDWNHMHWDISGSIWAC